MALSGFVIEASYTGIIAGVDEAGRGPWAGPVVAAAVIFKTRHAPRGINDSKQLTRLQREELFEFIMARAVVGVGICSVEEVDEHNILGATKRAMRRAYDGLSIKPDVALVDGNQLPDMPCEMDAIIDGDALCVSIAAASIIAKVTRDRMMVELAKDHPHYGWERNAGYGTREHQEALAKHGVTAHHRKSFAPIRKLLQQVAA
jgi:ribonuclease HII